MDGELCRAPVSPAEVPRLDPDAWEVRRRRAVRLAANHRAVGAEQPPTSTVLLDIGGVVIPTLFESVAVPGFPGGPFAGEGSYRDVEQGRLPEREYWNRVAQRHPQLDIGMLWRACSQVRGEIRTLIVQLGGRVRLAAFTNDMSHWFGEQWQGRFVELRAFDVILEASRLGVHKPEPEAFHAAARALAEPAARILFVDDLAANLDGAESVGMQTMLFDVLDPAGSVRRLLARVGSPAEAHGPAAARVFRVTR
ncbi:MAG: HAD-IA family hydrolase [Pseudonocardiaceae bacterium]|nr:HAD-IA family hydrolase [Pseudonocardiaceae bacterium]